MKTKKILSLVLALAMILSTIGIPAFADEVSEWDGVSFNTDWCIEERSNPAEGKVYEINSAADLAGLAHIINTWRDGYPDDKNNTWYGNNAFQGDTVKLNVDIDLKGYEWAPIGWNVFVSGGDKNAFRGNFDGQGHTIKNLYVPEKYEYAGLFGKVVTQNFSQTFKNVTVENAVVTSAGENAEKTGKLGAGALIGDSYGSYIDNCHVTGTINIESPCYAGGLVGFSRSNISNSTVTASGTVEATDSCAGGLAGYQIYHSYNDGKAAVSGCSVTGADTGFSIKSNGENVGGLIGFVSPSNAENLTIDKVSVSNVSVEADTDESGTGVAYIAKGFAATNATFENITTTVAGEEVVASDIVAKIGDAEYLSLADAIAEADDNGEVLVLKDIESIPNPGKPLTFKAAEGVKVTGLSGSATGVSGTVTYEGFTFTGKSINGTGTDKGGFNAYMGGQEDLDELTTVFKKCTFGSSDEPVNGPVIMFGWNAYMNNQDTKFLAKEVVVDGCIFYTAEDGTAPVLISTAKKATITNNKFIGSRSKNAINFTLATSDINVSGNDISGYATAIGFGMNRIPEGVVAEAEVSNNVISASTVAVNLHKDMIDQGFGGEFDVVTLKGNDITAPVAVKNAVTYSIDEIVVVDAYDDGEGNVTPNTVNGAEWTDVNEYTQTTTTFAAKMNGKNYSTIQAAVDAADTTEGAVTITVLPGEHAPFIVNTHDITFEGQVEDGKNPAIVITDALWGGVKYNASNLTFKNLDFVISEEHGDRNPLQWAYYALGYDTEAKVNGVYAVRNNTTLDNCNFVNESDQVMNGFFACYEDYTVKNCTFTNLETAISTMNDNTKVGTVVVEGNKFTNVDYPMNGYWGAPNGESSITLTNNEVEGAYSKEKAEIVLWNHALTQNKEGTAIANITESGTVGNVDLILVENTDETTVNASLTPVIAYSSVAKAMTSVAEGESFIADFDKATEATYKKTGDTSYEDSEGNVYDLMAAEIVGANKKYETLEAAIAAANSGEIVRLLGDAEISSVLSIGDSKNEKNLTIDLNGKTLTYAEGDQNVYYGDLTFKNGAMVLTDTVMSQGLFRVRYGKTLTLDDVDFVAVGNEDAQSTYIFDIENAYLNVINDSTVTVSDFELWGGVFVNNGPTGVNGVTISDSTVAISNIDGNAFTQGGMTITDSEIDITNVDSAIRLGAVDVPFVINGATTINISESENGMKVYPGRSVEIADTAVVTITDSIENDVYLEDSTANVTVADSAELNGVVSVGMATVDPDSVTEESVTETIEIKLEKTINERVYNIVATAENGKVINRLTAVELQFNIDTDAINYTIEAADGIALTDDLTNDEAYLFSLKALPDADKTGERILLGTVSFDGYSAAEFTFSVVSGYEEAEVQATKFETNDVETFVVANGTLIIDEDASTGAITLSEPARDVIVTVEFPNGITAGNDADYNDMTVTLTGANGEIHVGKIGCDVDDDETDNVIYADYDGEKAVFTFADVTAEYRYTFEISGAGYRTYRYTTLVGESDEALNIKFWNDAKYQGKEDVVEAGVSEATDVTFLAGDIVRDNEINKYDLSAVVSYFGTYNLSLTNHPEYNKYDLNRDGEIDSKDVAYVLVSWGK